MSLKTLIESQVATVFLNTDHFAEAVRLYPPDDPDPREVTAIVVRGEEPFEETRGERRRLEICTVFARSGARRDGAETIAHADGDVRLVTRLALRLDGDGADEAWDFREVVEVGGGMVSARFHRARIERTGDLTSGLG